MEAPPRPSPEDFRKEIPEELANSLRAKDKDVPDQGFVFKLWHLLEWAGTDQTRGYNLGLGWKTDDEFFLEKARFCAVMQMPTNTLNFKLRIYKFKQSKQRQHAYTFWTCQKFTRHSTHEDLETVQEGKNRNEECLATSMQALYWPILDGVRIFTGTSSDATSFKVEALFAWEEIVNYWIWAVSRTEFIARAAAKFCTYVNGSGETFVFDAQQTELGQYLKSNDLNLDVIARQMLNYVVKTKKPDIVTVEDFCMFVARFGPFDCILEKIHQLLCCSQAFGDWFQPGEQEFDTAKPVTGSYSNTFANCFIIKRSSGVTYHVYNLPSSPTNQGFLVDETSKKFLTWHAVFEHFSTPTQQTMLYHELSDGQGLM